MPEAEQSYLCDNPTAMTRRQLLATAVIAMILPKPAMPITCIGMKPTVADLAPFPPTCIGMPWPRE